MTYMNSVNGTIPNSNLYFNLHGFNIKIFSTSNEFEKSRSELEAFLAEHVHNADDKKSSYIIGTDQKGFTYAFLNTIEEDYLYKLTGEITFSSPIIIKSKGNFSNFYKNLSHSWDKFDAIRFVGGNINTIRNPKQAVLENIEFSDDDVISGKLRINTISNNEQSIEFPITIKDKKAKMSISSFVSGIGNMSKRALGYADSMIKILFKEPQEFSTIMDLFDSVKDIIMLLTRHFNTQFSVYLEQKVDDISSSNTAECKINFVTEIT